MGLGELFGGMGLSLGGIGSLITIILIVIIAILIVGSIIYFFWNRKQWNLEIEFHIPRQVQYLKPGEILDIEAIKCSIDLENGKGAYNTSRGGVFLKRKGKKKVAMKPFNVSKYLFGGNKLKVVQIGSEEYVPIAPQSYVMYEDDKTGEMCALLKLHTDSTTSRPWKSSFERNAKQAFSIMNFFKEHQTMIMIGLVIFLWGIQTLILYNRMK